MRRFTVVGGIGLLALAGCEERVTSFEPSATLDGQLRQELQFWGVVPIGPVPVQAAAQVQLGQVLFFDKVLSGNRDVACASCHHPAASLGGGQSLAIGTGGSGFGETRTLGAGREFVPRSAPSLLNSGLGAPYAFWDGRLSMVAWEEEVRVEAGPALPKALPNILAAQAMLPVLDRREMRGRPGDTDVFGEANALAELPDDQHGEIWRTLTARLLEIPAYEEMFRAAFPELRPDEIGFEHAARALAAFQFDAFTKTGSPFDRYLEGDDVALTAREKRGALLFFNSERARCGSCHGGPLLGGEDFANVGVPQIGPGVGKALPKDLGRGEHQKGKAYHFAFRVPPLRNVELTAPYTHSGAFRTLEAVVRHYDDVPKALREYDPSQLEPAVRALVHDDEALIEEVLDGLDDRVQTELELTDEEVGQLVAFLESLTDPAARELDHLIPAEVPSGLPVDR